MSQTPMKGYPQCIYCGSENGKTKDHVPPEGFFPKPKPTNLIKVPACESCNNGASKDEEWLLAILMFTDAGVSKAGKKHWDQKLHRMYRKNHGLRRKIAKSLQKVNLFTPMGLFAGRAMTIEHDERRSSRVLNKIVRGLYYHEYKEALPPTVSITCKLLKRGPLIAEVDKYASQLQFGSRQWPDLFEYRFNRVAERPQGSMWLIRFFGNIVFWVITIDNK